MKLEVYSVEDKLPESNYSDQTPNFSKYCLVWDSFNDYYFAYYDRKHKLWFLNTTGDYIDDIQYWAEIPKLKR